jgi:hypothetical protein
VEVEVHVKAIGREFKRSFVPLIRTTSPSPRLEREAKGVRLINSL